jgi:Spy/CpxP family protein refolding chaperone
MKTTLSKLVLGISLATLSCSAIAHSYHDHSDHEEEVVNYDPEQVKSQAKRHIQELNQVLKLNLTREQFQKMWKATTEFKIYKYETSSDEDLDFYNEKYMDYMDSVLTEEQKSRLAPMQTPPEG